jgi:RIO kinase 1
MPKIDLKHFDQDFETYADPRRRQQQATSLRRPGQSKRSDHAVLDEILKYSNPDWAGSADAFTPTFTSSRYEREWILNYLGPFYDDKHIADVLCKVRGGKEANVYCCLAHPSTDLDLIAAKIYRPRMFRNLRNDARYRQGRPILDDQGVVIHDGHLLHAVQKKTNIGKELEHTSWLAHEFQTMQLLYDAGADVPRPLTRGNNVILMEYVGDEKTPAPTLNQVTLGPGEAPPLFERLMRNVELMLVCQRIHGDLSAYNVLYWGGDLKIIDFPQAVDPRLNPDARAILERDVERLCEYFARYGVSSDAAELTQSLWARYGSVKSLALPEDSELGS